MLKTNKFLAIIALFLFVVSMGSCGGGGGGDGGGKPSIDQMSQIIDAGAKYYNDLIANGVAIDNALNDTVNWFKLQDGVTDVYVAADGINFFIEDITGITTLFVPLSLVDTSLQSQHSLSSTSYRALQSISSVASQRNAKAIILDPLNRLPALLLADFLISEGVTVNYLKGEQVTPLTFIQLSQLNDYDIIYYFGHGSISSTNTAIGTGEPFSQDKLNYYLDIIREKGYTVGAGERNFFIYRMELGPGASVFAITDYFIRNLAKGLKATVVYVDACNTGRTDWMAKAFISNGAKSYLGWDWYVEPWGGMSFAPWLNALIGELSGINKVAKEFFTDILNCQNVQAAFNDLSFDFQIADLKWYGEGSATLPYCVPIIYKISDYYPLGQGDTWTYRETWNGDVSSYTITVSGTEIINGVEAIKVVTQDGGYSLYTVDSNGVKFYKQYGEEDSNWGQIIFTPPINYSPGEVFIGTKHPYSSNFNLTSNIGNTATGIITGESTVVGFEDVIVQAGTFKDCLKITIKQTITTTGGTTKVEPASTEGTIWFAKGVGGKDGVKEIATEIFTDGSIYTVTRELLSATVGGINYPQ